MNIFLYLKHVKNFFCFLLKNIIFSIYLFSSTYYYLFYIIVALIGIFYVEKNNYLVSFCTYILFFYIGFSTLLCFCLNIKVSYLLIEKIVGTPFLDKYFPVTRFALRGIYPIMVYTSTLFLLLALNTLSLELFQSIHDRKIASLQKQSALLFEEREVSEGIKISKKVLEEIEKGAKNTGIFVKWVNNSSISKFIEMFNIKK